MTTIFPRLKGLHSPDVFDLESYVPADPTCFNVFIQAMFGSEGDRGEESFDIEVCTPQWLAGEVDRKGIVSGRHRLIVWEYSFPLIRSYLVKYASHCSSKTWHEVGTKLARIGHWEFEDYRPYQDESSSIFVIKRQPMVELSLNELTYLKNSEFLELELAREIDAARDVGHGRYKLSVSRDVAEEFRSALTDRLARVGFDTNDEITSEGRMLEELIDRFYPA